MTNKSAIIVPLNDRPAELYRHYDADGCLLYVGVSGDAAKRLKDHESKGVTWCSDVATTIIDKFESRSLALAAEKEAIQTEDPAYNRVHSRIRPHKPNLKLEGGKRVNIYLDPESLRRAKILGKGNVSEGIRRALADHHQNESG